MPNEQIISVPSIGASAGARPARVGDGLLAKLGALLSKALEDVTSIEVRTFTSDAGDATLATSGDPLVAHTKLRAFTRVAIDGDTQICVPLRAGGEPDEALWKLHTEAVAAAREDRAKTIAAAIAVVKELGGPAR